MSANDSGRGSAHKTVQNRSVSSIRRRLHAEATHDLDDDLRHYRCSGCSELCLNGAEETTSLSGLCIDCCSFLLVDHNLTGARDEQKLAAARGDA